MEIKKQEVNRGNASDHLANERTFLAWIRTAIATMGFGFVVVKFSLFIKQLSLTITDKPPAYTGKGYSGVIGIFLVSLGAVITLLSYIRYRRIEHYLKTNTFYPSSLLTILLTLLILITGVLLMLYLVPNI